MKFAAYRAGDKIDGKRILRVSNGWYGRGSQLITFADGTWACLTQQEIVSWQQTQRQEDEHGYNADIAQSVERHSR